MAGRPPPDFGGDRQFIVDPQATGISTVVGDMAALSLQLIHILRDVVPDDSRALVDGIAAQTRQVLAASNASHNREQSTRELRPVTRVPVAAYGANHNTTNIRMHNVPMFAGSEQDTLDVVRWISRILTLAEAHGLTFDATINLMIQGSNGSASDYIQCMKEEGKTLHQVVQQLEMRYGDLCTPEEARVKCNNMPRKLNEGLSEFIDRLRTMARMACRLEANDGPRRLAIDNLVEGNIRRVLPTSVRNALEERVINRNRMGLPAFTAREIEKECLDLERRRIERKQEIVGQSSKRLNVRNLYKEDYFNSLPSEEDSSSENESSQDEDDTMCHLVNEIKQQQLRYTSRGRPIDNQKVYRKAFRNFNRKFPPKYPAKQGFAGKEPQFGARQAQGAPHPGHPGHQKIGPPNKLEHNPKRTIGELLNLANCSKGQCIQCGYDGHIMHQDACALRDRPLVDRPCVKCGKGLHSADDCLKVFQQQYVSPRTPQLTAAVQNESLNDK